jgi:hypothetical protein
VEGLYNLLIVSTDVQGKAMGTKALTTQAYFLLCPKAKLCSKMTRLRWGGAQKGSNFQGGLNDIARAWAWSKCAISNSF